MQDLASLSWKNKGYPWKHLGCSQATRQSRGLTIKLLCVVLGRVGELPWVSPTLGCLSEEPRGHIRLHKETNFPSLHSMAECCRWEGNCSGAPGVTVIVWWAFSSPQTVWVWTQVPLRHVVGIRIWQPCRNRNIYSCTGAVKGQLLTSPQLWYGCCWLSPQCSSCLTGVSVDARSCQVWIQGEGSASKSNR